MTSSSDIGIIVRFCGNIVGATQVDRMIDYDNLLRVLSDIARLDLNLYSLKVFSVHTDGNSIPIKNNRDLRFFFDPNAGFNSVELLVRSETQVHLQASHNAWKNQYYQSVRSNHGGGNDTNVGPSDNTNYFAMQNTIVLDLSGDHFGATDLSNSEPSDNGSSDEGSSDRDDTAEEQLSKVTRQPISFSASLYEDLPIDLIGTSRGGVTYNADHGVLEKGMIFRDKKHLQSAVKDYSVRHARCKYRVVGTTPTTWKLVCKQNIDNDINPSSQHCQWFLRAKFAKKYNHWVITYLGRSHSCLKDTDSKSHKNPCVDMLEADIESKVLIEPEYKVKFVVEHALTQYNYKVSYKKAWQMLKRARENVFGTWKSSCQYLPKFMGALQKYNPGTIVGWRHKDGNIGVVHTLGYVFWAFRPCIEAFKHCRKILTVDATHLYTKYKHKLLIANTLDADQKIISVAYAIVDEENFQSWYWFLQMLATHIVRDVGGICLISGIHKDILKAVEYIPVFHPPRGVHRYCLRHVASNINTQFKSAMLKNLCYTAGKSLTVRKFELTMNEIKNLSHDAYEYLTTIDPSKWTFCHDRGHRFGVMTTNMSEAINGVLKGIQRLPITVIVSRTFIRSRNAFFKREEAVRKMQQRQQGWPAHVSYRFDTEQRLGMKHHVDIYDYSRQAASVACVDESRHLRKYTVSLTEQECSCGQWKLDRIPCSHAFAVCRQYKVNPAMYVPYCYSSNAYVKTYSSSVFVPLPDEEEWDEPWFQLKHNPDRKIRCCGRDVTSNISNEMENQAPDSVGPSFVSRSG